MPQLFPFRGYRYSSRVPDLSAVVTQPYDKITAAARQLYYSRSQHNVAHIISNPDYGQAGRIFASWMRDGILEQDRLPGFYAYRQQFQVAESAVERTGVIGLLDLATDQAAVLRHERVMDAPLKDRLSLIGATESNDGLIFMLVDDSEAQLESLLGSAIQDLAPSAEVQDEFGGTNQLWHISDPQSIQSIQIELEKGSFYIADGHHRFETAIRYAKECRSRDWSPAAVESFDKRMVALFSSSSSGVVILPTHRALRGLRENDVISLLENLKESFEISEQGGPEMLLDSLNAGPLTLGKIGLLLGPQPSAYLLRDAGARDRLLGDLTPTARELDVNLLHGGILEPMLGIGEAELASQNNVDYYRNYRNILPGLASRKYQMAFLLNATSADQVRRISQEGGRMPQKSTDFYPKLLTGLVFMKMEIERQEPSSEERDHG